MTPQETALAEQVYGAIQRSSNYSERSQQSSDFRIGVSDLGYCSEKVRRMVAGIPEPVTDKLAAFIGTAIGDHVELACEAMWPQAIRQPVVSLILHADGGDYTVIGHPDLVLPEGILIDVKSSRGFSVVQRTGPSQQQQFQRHCYALAAFEADLFTVPLDEVRVANVWVDRSADTHHVHVDMEPFSMDVVNTAAMWLDDVAYAYLHGQEARKEPAREVCAKTCGHFPDCRALDTDIEGLLTDDATIAAVDLYTEANRMEREAKKMKDQAKAHLAGVSGSTGKYSVRWIHTNGGHVAFDRQPSDRLDIRPIT
jgi:hypothetical protein